MLVTILIITLSIYILLCLAFYFFQHIAFFRPEILPKHFKYVYQFPFEELDFKMEDGGRVNAVYFKVPNSQGVVYYLKGNSKSIKGWGKFAKDYLGNGYDFFMMDYRGFGKSKGKRTQEKLFNDAQFLYNWLLERYPEKKIVLFGRSFGSGVAAKLASINNAKLLILDSPYFSFYHNTKRFLFFMPLKWLLRYDIRTDKYLKTTNAPIYIIHGTKDKLFPISQSEALVNLFPGKVKLFKIEGGGHNNLPEFKQFFEILYNVLNKQ